MEEQEKLDMDEVFAELFADIHKSQTEGCFQRLVCDIAANPEDYKKNNPILVGVEMMENHSLNSTMANSVTHLLLEAAKFGRNATDGRECEDIFHNCSWTGQQMDKVITKFDSQVTLLP